MSYGMLIGVLYILLAFVLNVNAMLSYNNEFVYIVDDLKPQFANNKNTYGVIWVEGNVTNKVLYFSSPSMESRVKIIEGSLVHKLKLSVINESYLVSDPSMWVASYYLNHTSVFGKSREAKIATSRNGIDWEHQSIGERKDANIDDIVYHPESILVRYENNNGLMEVVEPGNNTEHLFENKCNCYAASLIGRKFVRFYRKDGVKNPRISTKQVASGSIPWDSSEVPYIGTPELMEFENQFRPRLADFLELNEDSFITVYVTGAQPAILALWTVDLALNVSAVRILHHPHTSAKIGYFNPRLCLTSNGTIFLFMHNKTSDSIRDFFLSSSDDLGKSWKEPRLIREHLTDTHARDLVHHNNEIFPIYSTTTKYSILSDKVIHVPGFPGVLIINNTTLIDDTILFGRIIINGNISLPSIIIVDWTTNITVKGCINSEHETALIVKTDPNVDIPERLTIITWQEGCNTPTFSISKNQKSQCQEALVEGNKLSVVFYPVGCDAEKKRDYTVPIIWGVTLGAAVIIVLITIIVVAHFRPKSIYPFQMKDHTSQTQSQTQATTQTLK